MPRLLELFMRVKEQTGPIFLAGIAIFILMSIFAIAGGGVSQQSRWHIDTVMVVGSNTVPVEKVRALTQEKLLGNYFFVYARGNSYLYPQQEIEKTLLEAFPRFATVTVSRTDAHTLKVQISERTPYALWCGTYAEARGINAVNTQKKDIVEGASFHDCWFIDRTGFVFDHAPVFSKGVYREFYGGLTMKDNTPLRGVLLAPRFGEIDGFVQVLDTEIGKIEKIVMGEENQFDVVVASSTAYPFMNEVMIKNKDGYTSPNFVKNLRSAIAVQFPENTALKKKLLYIDMRFGNKIFFGFENS